MPASEDARAVAEGEEVNSVRGNFLSIAYMVMNIGAAACSFWLLYLMFSMGGVGSGILWIFLLALAFKFGAGLMFIVAASVISFHFQKVGIWLPIVSYALGVVTLIDTLRHQHPAE